MRDIEVYQDCLTFVNENIEPWSVVRENHATFIKKRVIENE